MMARSLVLGATLLSAPRLGWCASKKAAGTPAVTIALTSTPIRRALPGSIAGGISRPPLRQSQPCSQRQARTCASGAPMAAGAAKDGDVIFRQLFDAQFGSSTFTYILGCPDSREAVIVDPVLELVDRDLGFIDEMGLNLRYAVNTHCHADHITGTGEIKKRLPSVQSGISRASGAKVNRTMHVCCPSRLSQWSPIQGTRAVWGIGCVLQARCRSPPVCLYDAGRLTG
mmetsp:Transcript_24866/g.69302  ORF Transcript_24866/g.69302 Transcript_24866/m.69302 type:complete len:228 (-) Transcript_24866:1237-1920(-)